MARTDGLHVDELLDRTIECECGGHHRVPTRVAEFEPGSIGRVPEIVRDLVDADRVLVIADRRTWQAAGRRVHAELRPSAEAERVVVPDDESGHLHASVELVDRLEAEIGDHDDLYVAVGSGTINDITKELAHRRSRPYIVVATAASMNGYTSSIVALVDQGLKTTGAAEPPLAVIADPEVLAAAPLELTLAGLGDLVSKPFCGCDWWISSIVTGEPYCPLPSRILDTAFDGALDAFPRLAERDPEAVVELARLLVLSGITMTIAGTSSPASGGEHLLSHYWDMINLRDGRPLGLHGAQVGVASVAMDSLYAEVLESEFEDAEFEPEPQSEDPKDELQRVFGSLAEAVWPHWRAKLARRSQRDLETLRLHQSAIKAEIATVLASGRKVRAALAGAGAPMWAANLGIARSDLTAAIRHGRKIRNRYTVLDVAAELGLLETFATECADRGKAGPKRDF